MESIKVSRDEMLARLVRHQTLVPRAKLDAAATGLPEEAIRMLQADANYTYMAPEMKHGSQITKYAVTNGGDAGDCMVVSMAICEPGNGPALHMHANTVETFFCAQGRFSIQWGDEGEEEITLEKFDLLSIPAGLTRRFTNVSDERGVLLVLLQGDQGKFNDITYTPSLGHELAMKFGTETVTRLEGMGRGFTAGLAEVGQES
jgi:mannose-6-phosphate isomerase-like protein (cupin superfamily)